MKRRRPGRVRSKLAGMLSERLGTYISPDDLREAAGFWRTSGKSEALRWEGPKGIGSWNTMTDCVRYGFNIEQGTMATPTTLGRGYPIAINARTPPHS